MLDPQDIIKAVFSDKDKTMLDWQGMIVERPEYTVIKNHIDTYYNAEQKEDDED